MHYTNRAADIQADTHEAKAGQGMDATTKRLVSIPEARQLLGNIGHTTLYELVNRREIVKVNIGRRGLITSESLEAYMDRLSTLAETNAGDGAA